MNPPQETARFQEMCQCLRSKEMHYLPRETPDDDFSSGIYWCNKTHEPFGPDGQEVSRTNCNAGRSCFLS